jgi:hypothetical protein
MREFRCWFGYRSNTLATAPDEPQFVWAGMAIQEINGLQTPWRHVDRPKQRQVILAVPGGHSFVLLRQTFNAALFHKQLPDLAPESGLGSPFTSVRCRMAIAVSGSLL